MSLPAHPQTPAEANTPRADHVRISGCSCGACGHVFLWLMDQKGRPIAVAPFAPGSATTIAFELALVDQPAGRA